MELKSTCTLRQHQEVLLELLCELDRICKKHHISYTLFAGTAIGAVRHQGFIPWDDDLDIAMLRTEYERFMEVAPRELGKAYFLQREFTDHWPMFFSKLRKNGTTCLERYVPKDHQTHHGVYIDIFPCDNLSEGKLMRKIQFAASKVVIAKSLGRRGYLTDSAAKKVFIGVCRSLPRKPFYRLVRQDKKGTSQKVHTFFGAASKFEKNIFPRDWFTKTVEMEFEGRKFPVSAHYEELLTAIYGDYRTLPPVEERGCKVHAEFVDLEHSYENHRESFMNLKIEEYSRSIR